MKAQCNLLSCFYLENYFIHVSMDSYIEIGIYTYVCVCINLTVVGFVVKKCFLILFLPSQAGSLLLPELCAYFHPCFHSQSFTPTMHVLHVLSTHLF